MEKDKVVKFKTLFICQCVTCKKHSSGHRHNRNHILFSSTGPMRRMIWQQRTLTMMSPSNAKVNEHERERMNNTEGAQYERERMNNVEGAQYERQRMNIVCRAVALVTSIVSFLVVSRTRQRFVKPKQV